MELHECCINGDMNNFLRLINENNNINQKNADGYTPLHLALINGNTEIAKELIKYGANILDEDKYGRTALYFSREQNNVEMFEELIKNTDIKDPNNFIKMFLQCIV